MNITRRQSIGAFLCSLLVPSFSTASCLSRTPSEYVIAKICRARTLYSGERPDIDGDRWMSFEENIDDAIRFKSRQDCLDYMNEWGDGGSNWFRASEDSYFTVVCLTESNEDG